MLFIQMTVEITYTKLVEYIFRKTSFKRTALSIVYVVVEFMTTTK